MRAPICTAMAALLAALVASTTASAFELTGAWASDVNACGKIFAKKGSTFIFRDKSDIHGSGFIVDGNQIRGRSARCRITTKRETDSIILLIASCATDVMLSTVPFTLKVKDANHISRTFPGMEDLQMDYERCP